MFIESPTRYVTPHAGHASRQPLRLPLRYAHRVSLHPGHYGTGLHRHSMRFTTRAVFASLTCTRPRAPQRPRHAASDYALAACHVLCGDGALPKSSLRSKVARRGRRASWKRRRSSARPLRFSVNPASSMMSPPRPGSAKPRGAAPELGRHYAAAGRATSHNGARYASVHPKPRPAKTRSASWGSHVALSGAPPRWNRSVLFPWRCPAAAAWSVMPATTGRNIAAALFNPQAPMPRGRGMGDVPLAPRPPGAGRVGRAEDGPSWSALMARGLCGQSPRPVFAGCHMSREPPRPVPLAGRFKLAAACAACEDARVFAVLSFKRPASPFPR